MKITLEFLRARTADERWIMYKNAMAKGGPDAERLMALIDEHQLSMRERGGFPEEHPTIRAIRDVCFSSEGIAAAERAIREGQAALAYVDPLLQSKVSGYAEPDTHSWAGEYVAQAMEHQGYRRTTMRKKLPDGCSAKTAMVLKPK